MISRILSVFLCIIAFPTANQAQSFKAKLIGYNEPIPVLTDGLGNISAEYDGQFLSIEGIVKDLSSDFDPDVDGAVSLYIGIDGTIGVELASLLPFVDDDNRGFELIDIANRIELTEEQVEALFLQQLYINVATTDHPNGEIRAQLIPAEAQEFHCLLTGSGVAHPVPTRGIGHMLLTFEGDSVTVSGSFRDLEGVIDVNNLDVALLKSEYAGTDGVVLGVLSVTADTVSNAGIVSAADNTFYLDPTQQINLHDGGIYVEVVSDYHSRGEIRGQAIPPAKQLYMAHLRSYNTIPFNNSKAVGAIIIERNHGDSLRLTGSYNGLESPIATQLAGGAIWYEGVHGREGSVFELLNPSLQLNGTIGKFLFTDHFYTFLPDDIAKLDNNEFYIVVHSEERFDGEIRGQIKPIAQNYFSSVLNDIQKNDGTVSFEKSYVDIAHMGSDIVISGSVMDPEVSVTENAMQLRNGLAGTTGDIWLGLTLQVSENDSNAILYPGENQFTIDSASIQTLFERRSYLSLRDTANTEMIRGQVFPTAQSIYMVPMSDRHVPEHIDSEARGFLLAEQHDDNDIIYTGHLDGLSAPLLQGLFNKPAMYLGKYGETGISIHSLVPDVDADLRGADFLFRDNRFSIQNAIKDSLANNALYINIPTVDHEQGEIRGQMLKLADAYYQSRIDAINVVRSSVSSGSGLFMFIQNDNEVSVTGSFEGLSAPIDIMNEGGLSLREGDLTENGELKFLLFPQLSMDSLSGTEVAQRLFLDEDEQEDIVTGRNYVELRKQDVTTPALRGQILPMGSAAPVEPIIISPENRDTVLIDGIVTDTYVIEVDAAADEILTLQLSDRPDFMPTQYAYNYLYDQQISITYQVIDSILEANDQIIGDTLRLYYRISGSDGGDYVKSELRSIYFVRGLVTAVPLTYRAHMSANHEMPPRQSTGYGEIQAELVDNQLRISGNIDELLSEVDESIAGGIHLHIGYAGQNGPILFPLVPQIDDDGRGLSLSVVDNTFTLSQDMLDTLDKRALYVNVHTVDFPAGELRGQLLPPANEYYYCNLMASNIDEPYFSSAAGAVSIELSDGEMVLTGSFSGLGSAFDITQDGGTNIHLGVPGRKGLVFNTLTTRLIDDFSGVYEANANTYFLNNADQTLLTTRNLMIDVHTEDRSDGAIQGMITGISRGLFRSRLSSLHHRDKMISDGNGVVQIELGVNDEIGVYGAFNALAESTFDQQLSLGVGHGEQLSTISGLDAILDVDSQSGIFNYAANQISLTDEQTRQLLHRALYVNIDHGNGIGGVKGQALGLAQDYGFAIMTGYQSKPMAEGGSHYTIYTERIGDEISFSGTLRSEQDQLILGRGLAGIDQGEIMSYTGVAVADQQYLNPNQAVYQLNALDLAHYAGRSLYLSTTYENDRMVRGQLMNNVHHLYVSHLSGIEVYPSVDTEMVGTIITELSRDGELRHSGSVIGVAAGSSLSLQDGFVGLPDQPVYELSSSIVSDTLQVDGVENIYTLTSDINSSLMAGSMRLSLTDVNSEQVAGAVRPIANKYYTSTLNGDHTLTGNPSDGGGKLYIDVAGSTVMAYGSFFDLISPIEESGPDYTPLAFNFVYEDLNPTRELTYDLLNSRNGRWLRNENAIGDLSNINDALDNQLVNVGVYTEDWHPELRGKLIEITNQFPDATGVQASVPLDTLRIEGTLINEYVSSWAMANDDEEIMYRYTLALDADMEDLIFLSNTENNRDIVISYIQLQSLLINAGVEQGDTIQLYQQVYLTDGSEDIYTPITSFTAILGIVEDPIFNYRAYLSGAQVAHPVLSTGQGEIDLIIQGDVISISGSFTGLTSSLATQINGGVLLQVGAAGEEGQVLYPLDVDTGADATSGTISSADNTFEILPEIKALILDRSAYIQVYSTDTPTGELRGQILPVAQNYYQAIMTDAQNIRPAYDLDYGAIIIEEYDTQLRMSGTLHESDNLGNGLVGLFLGLPGEEGQLVQALTYSVEGDVFHFSAEQNVVNKTPNLMQLINNGSTYVAVIDSDQRSLLRGQILPESRAILYSNVSALKAVPIQHNLAHGRMMASLTRDDALEFCGSVSRLESSPGNTLLAKALPGSNGSEEGTLSMILSSDGTQLTALLSQNEIELDIDDLQDLLDREYYVHTLSEEGTSMVRGQLLNLSARYAESIITGSQVSANASSGAYGMLEMEVTPDDLRSVGSLHDLPMELDDIELIRATSGLEGDIISSLSWTSSAPGSIEIAYDANRINYNSDLADNISDNEVSVRAHSVEFPLGVARGLLIPPAQGLYVAPLSGASFIDRVDTPGHGMASLILRNDNDILFVVGVDQIPLQSLRFRFGKTPPGIDDDNPFNFLGFQMNPFGGAAYNNGDINPVTDQIIDDLRQGAYHAKVSTFSNNAFVDFVRGQLFPVGYQAYQGTFGAYHIQGTTAAESIGKIKASLVGNTLYIIGSTTMDPEQITSASFGLGDVYTSGATIDVVDLDGATIPYQSFNLAPTEVEAVKAGESFVRISSTEYPSGAIRAQLIPEINYYPGEVAIDIPSDGLSVTIEGDDSQSIFITWSSAPDPDPLKYIWELSQDPDFQSANIIRWIDNADSDVLSLSYGDVHAILTEELDLSLGQSITLYHRVVSTDGSEDTYSEELSITLTVGTLVGVDEEIIGVQSIQLLPNVTIEPSVNLHMEMLLAQDLQITIVDSRGAIIQQYDPTHYTPGEYILELDVPELTAGTYYVLVATEDHTNMISLAWIIQR